MQWRELQLFDGNTLSVGVIEPEVARVTLICAWLDADHRSFLNQAPLVQGIRLVFDRRGFGECLAARSRSRDG